MKILLATLSISSLLYGAPPISDGPAELPLHLEYQPILAEPLISTEEIALPQPILEPRYKSPTLAVGLSVLFPGLGHVYLGDTKTAGGLLGSASAGLGMSFLNNEAIHLASLETVSTAWSYGIYAAYRDARALNGSAGYSYKMPTDSFVDLSTAPFRLSVLKKPAVWGGFLGAFAVATGVIYLGHAMDAPLHVGLASTSRNLYPLIAFPVGVSEESLFRGYLQSQLSEVLTPWGGIAVSSLLFGAAHIPNALALPPENRRSYYTFSIPFITALGVYFGWLTHKNQSLKESVALHAWYDFTLFAISALATQAASTGCSRFAIAVPF